MRVLTRMWQMLLKSLEEVAIAPNAMMAAEMAVIRLTHVADLPDPEALIRRIQSAQSAGQMTAPARAPTPSGPSAHAPAPVRAVASGGAIAQPQAQPDAATAFAPWPDWQDVLDLIRRMGDVPLLVLVENHIRLIRYAPGRIEFSLAGDPPADFVQRLAERLRGWAGGHRWGIVVAREGGAATVAETREAAREAAFAQARALPMVQAVLAAFPQARLVDVRPAPHIAADDPSPGEDSANHADTAGPVAAVEEWDPFDDEE